MEYLLVIVVSGQASDQLCFVTSGRKVTLFKQTPQVGVCVGLITGHFYHYDKSVGLWEVQTF